MSANGNGSDDGQLEFGREQRDDGIHLVWSHTPLHWRISFWRAVQSFVGHFGGITSEDIRKITGPPPNHRNAGPAAVMKAKARGALFCIGRTLAQRPISHAAKLDVYLGNRDFDFDAAIEQEKEREQKKQNRKPRQKK